MCRELADQYESFYDYRNLSKMRVSGSENHDTHHNTHTCVSKTHFHIGRQNGRLLAALGPKPYQVSRRTHRRRSLANRFNEDVVATR